MAEERPTAETEPRWLLKHYYEGLSVSFLVAKTDNSDGINAELIQRVETLFSDSAIGQSWGNAYEIEQHLIYLYSDEALDEELQRRLIDLELHSDNVRFEGFKERSELSQERKTKQELLRDITHNVQQSYRKRDAKRDYSRQARVNSLYVFIGALVIFTLALVFSHVVPLDFADYDATTRTLVIGVCAGFLGSSFSVLLGLKTKLAEASIEDLRVLNDLSYLALRPFIGVGAALVFFFLVQSQLLDGNLFPDLPLVLAEGEPLSMRYPEISKMVVWSFISGFSEYFVPSLLVRTESGVRGGSP